MTDRPWWTVEQVAEVWGVDRCTVYRWIKTHRIRVYRTPTGRIRIPDQEVPDPRLNEEARPCAGRAPRKDCA